MEQKATIFFIMPFQDEYFESYEMIKLKFSDEYVFNNAAEEGNQQNILKDIVQPIYESDIVVADLTGLNSNVLYELGVAHTLNKKTIIITRDDLSTLPFDLKQYRAKNYTTHFLKFEELLKYLEINFKGAIKGTTIFSNPVNDFLSSIDIDRNHLFNQKANNVLLVLDGEKGFVDFLADIESDTTSLTHEIEEMTVDLHELTEGINCSTKEIERVNAAGGAGTASFVRKEARKVGKLVEAFGRKLQKHNSQYYSLWDKIEGNIIGLLENEISSKRGNQKPLIGYLTALKDTQYEIKNSNDSINKLKTSMASNKGVERSLTQAIIITESYLEEYINIMDNMDKSIDKVILKSKFVVGDITLQ